MTIEVSCDCSMKYRLPERYAGKTCRCRECGESIRVPSEAERSKKAEKKPRPTKKLDSAKAKARNARPVSERIGASESIHQMSPLNLSESRVSEPPAARKRAKAVQAKAVGLLEKKRKKAGARSDEKPSKVRRGGRSDEESEADLPPRSKKGRRDEGRRDEGDDEAPRKKGKLRRRSDERSDDRDDRDDEVEDDAFESERPKKKNKKAKKAEAEERKPARRGKARRNSADDADEDEGDDAEQPTKKLSKRAQKRRQQLMILGGSLGAALVCIGLLVGVIALGKHSEEKARLALADAKKKVQDAQGAAKAQDWTKAQQLYNEAIAFVDENKERIDDPEFKATYDFFKAENKQFIGRIVAARAKLQSDPQGAVKDFTDFTGAQQDEVVFLAGVQGLVDANDGSCVDLLATCAKTASFQSVKDAAIKGLIQLGVPQAAPFLANVIRTQGGKTDLGRAAVAKALEMANPDPDTLAAILQTDGIDASARSRAVKALGAFRDKKYEPLVSSLTKDPAIGKDAADALAELRGEKP